MGEGEEEMKDITINITSDTIVKVFFICAMVIFILSIGIVIGAYIENHSTKPTATVQPTPSQPTPIVTPTPLPTSSYPSVLTFTVLSTTTSTGHYQIKTTAGQVLYCSDYYVWNGFSPGNTYTADIDGTEGEAYLISKAVFIGGNEHNYVEPVVYFSDYPRYYYYNGIYYQYDGDDVDEISWKQARGERIIYGKPPVSQKFGSSAIYGDGRIVLINPTNT